MRILAIILIGLALLFANKGNSQPFYKHNEISFSLGTSNISGDISNQSTVSTIAKEARFMFGFSFYRVVNTEQSIGFELKSLSYFANDANHTNIQRGLEVLGSGNMASIQLRHIFFGNSLIKIKPFIKVGVGVFQYKARLNNNENYQAFPISKTFGFCYVTEVIPGLRYQISNTQSVSLEAVLIFSNRDSWDVVYDSDRTIDKIGGFRFTYSIALMR